MRVPDSRIFSTAGLALVMGAAVLAAPMTVFAADPLKLTVGPGRIELTPTAAGTPMSAVLNVTVSGGDAPATIAAGLADAVGDPSGGWGMAPLASTTYSLDGLVTVTPPALEYTPGAGERRFTVTVSVTPPPGGIPRVGLVTVTIQPKAAASGTVGITQGVGINTPLIVLPVGAAGSTASLPEVTASLDARGLGVAPAAPRWTLLDEIIPDLVPGLVDHGPLAISARFANTGDAVLDTRTSFLFSSLGPSALLPGSADPGQLLYRYNLASHYQLPGEVKTDEASSTIPLDGGGSVDSLPLIGIVRIDAQSVGAIGPVSSPVLTQTTTIVVFPWKELLALLALVGLWRLARRAWRRRRARPEPSA